MTTTAYIFDDSCFLETSIDLGTTWTETHTPNDSLADAWVDLEMAMVDQDYSTMLAFDTRFLGDIYSSRLAISHSAGINGSWSYLNPTKAGVLGTLASCQLFVSGALSKNGNTIVALAAPYNNGLAWPDSTISYPRISRFALHSTFLDKDSWILSLFDIIF